MGKIPEKTKSGVSQPHASKIKLQFSSMSMYRSFVPNVAVFESELCLKYFLRSE